MFSQSTSIHRKSIFVFAVLALLALAHPAHAQRGSRQIAQAQQPANPDKLDVTDLEKKYWAAKDTDFSVVQNRTYSKANRFGLSVQYGTLVNDPYSEATNVSGSLSYYFSERLGVELNYTNTKANDNGAVEAYKKISGTNGVSPDHGKQTGYYGASLNLVPFYAKVSVWNTKIIYFDMAISPGLGVTSYEQQIDPLYGDNIKKTAPTFSLDVSQMFFLGKTLAFRADYKNRWFNEDVVMFSTVNHGSKVRTDTNHTSLLMFGVTLFY